MAFARKERKAIPPTQPDMVSGCVQVTEIRYHGIWHYIEGTVKSACDHAASVTITVAYFDRDGAQIASGFEFTTLAPGATWHFENWAKNLTTQSGYPAHIFAKRGSVIDVQAF
jgi:hypothetical protein